MHADMQPFAPWSDANALLHIISVTNLHVVCVLNGLLGAILMLAIYGARLVASRDSRP